MTWSDSKGKPRCKCSTSHKSHRRASLDLNLHVLRSDETFVYFYTVVQGKKQFQKSTMFMHSSNEFIVSIRVVKSFSTLKMWNSSLQTLCQETGCSTMLPFLSKSLQFATKSTFATFIFNF